MIPEVKLIRLLIGIGVLVLIVVNYDRIKRIPACRILLAAYGAFLGAWLTSIFKELIWRDPLNLISHLFYTSSSIFLAAWVWQVFGRREGHKHESAGTD